ncbi:MAG: hypothetical protein Salg2KO_06870 [Salibacteraceae bacterium]
METGNSIIKEPGVEEYFDLSFSEESAHFYILIIELHDACVRACWYHKSKNLVTGFAEYTLNNGLSQESFSKLFEARPFLASEFDQCICVSNCHNYTLIPSSIQDSQVEELFKLGNPFKQGQKLKSQKLLNLKAHVYFQPSELEESVVDKCIPNVTYVSKVGSRIEHAMNQKQDGIAKNAVYVHIDTSRIHINAVNRGKLVLCNNYYHASGEDIAYYVLYAAEVLQMDPEKDTLVLSGDISIGDEVWKLLSNYWLNVKLDDGLKGITISNKINERPKGKFDYLTQHLLCAS